MSYCVKHQHKAIPDAMSGHCQECEIIVLREQIKDHHIMDSTCCLDAQNSAATYVAKALETIAETGEHHGVFGGEEIEHAAKTILGLSKRLDAHEYVRAQLTTAEKDIKALVIVYKAMEPSAISWCLRFPQKPVLEAIVAMDYIKDRKLLEQK